ncbi:MAG: hypothetical protein QOE86_3311, partial [Solirubrobacteraceae bacterium]|nr:hypothetical protein [Solirubrobacteraceae bacterium]
GFGRVVYHPLVWARYTRALQSRALGAHRIRA